MRTPVLLRVALVLAWTTFLVSSGVAADHGPPEGGKSNPLNFTGISRYDLGIYTLVVFGALVFLLGKFAWPAVIKMLDEREANIKNEYEAAENARKEALTYLEQVKAERAKAADEVRLLIEEARKDATALKDKLRADAAAEVQAERDRLRREIETARDQALQEIWSRTVELAALVSSKTVRRELTPDDHRRLMDEALVELKQNVTRA
jgi:F-type H+-transporting ATPase subunit b